MSEKKYEGATIGDMDGFLVDEEAMEKTLKQNLARLAKLHKLRFDSLVEVGFSEDQALQLCTNLGPMP